MAVKVRHPNIIENLEMDIRILYNWSIILSKTVLKSAAMPLTLDEFKRTLVS